eukprot:gene11689-15733_t
MTANVSFASASDTREQKPRLRELAPGAYGYISDFDPNCGFVVGDDQVVLIDTRPTPRMARDFLAAIRTVTDKPIKTIVLTHYHAVRVMGASAFGEVEQIIASNGTLDWIRTRGQADFLKLMTAQLQNQDPFNPVDNTQMVAQMAQFSSVAGISQMNTTLSSIAAKLTGTSTSDALSYVGRNVLTEGGT